MQIKDMTLREKIGQTMMVQKPHLYVKQFGSVEKFLEKYPIGSVYFGGEVAGGPIGDSQTNMALLNEMQKHLRIPLLIGGDFAKGISDGKLLNLPRQMALGAANDEGLAYEWGRMIGSAAREVGLHWIFYPETDLNLNPNNPVINVRALTDNPDLTKKLLKKVIEGIQSCGVAATSKHFPGVGWEDVDVHVTRSSSDFTREEWDNTYGKAFSHAINAGVAAVMTTHSSLECYQSEKECDDGLYRTATISKDITTGLLREKMGFSGVIVTDGLIMGGFSGSSCALEIESFLAGHDILLWPNLEYMDVMEEKILSGEIPEKLLDDAVERIQKLKEKTWLLSDYKKVETDSKSIVREVSEKSLTLLNNKKNLIPLDKDKIKNVGIVMVCQREATKKELQILKDILESRGINVMIKGDIWLPELKELEENNDLIIFAISRTPGSIGSIDLHADNAISVWASQTADKNKTIIASFGNPYFYKRYYKHIETYINAYSPTEDILEAFVKAIFGEIPFLGESPVEL